MSLNFENVIKGVGEERKAGGGVERAPTAKSEQSAQQRMSRRLGYCKREEIASNDLDLRASGKC